jgi:hypothetical protein
MKYFQLCCCRCNMRFAPLVATSTDELLNPDFGEVATSVSRLVSEAFETFYLEHQGHGLEAVAA